MVMVVMVMDLGVVAISGKVSSSDTIAEKGKGEISSQSLWGNNKGSGTTVVV